MPKGAVIVCPFFIKEIDKKIICEGVVDQTTTLIRFCSEDQKRGHRKMYCQGFQFPKCPIAEILNKKYEK